jgi:hypothetical protein
MATQSAAKQLFFHPFYSEQLCSSFLVWWKENLTYRILARPSERHAGTWWTTATCTETIGRLRNVSKVTRLGSSGNKQWPVPSNQLQCCIRSTAGVMRNISVKCHKCRQKLFLGLLHQDPDVKLLQVKPPYAKLKPPTKM